MASGLFRRAAPGYLLEVGDGNHYSHVVQAFKSFVLGLNNDLIVIPVDSSEWNWPLIEVVDQLNVKVAHLHVVASVGRHWNGQRSLPQSVLDWAIDLKRHQVDLGLQIELEGEELGVLDVVLFVVAGNELELVACLGWRVMLAALDLDIGLGLPWALDSDEARTTLLIVIALLLDLVAEAIGACVSRHWHLVDLVDLECGHRVELFGPADQLELGLSLEHEGHLLVRNGQGRFTCDHSNLISAFVAVFTAGNFY